MCLPACCARMLQLAGLPGGPARGIVAPTPGGSDDDRSLRFPHPVRRVVDLTHPLDPDFPTYDGPPQLRYSPLATHPSHGWCYGEWQIHEHTGTHLDAPLHRAADGRSVDLIPAADLVGPLAVIDLRDRAASTPDAELSVADLLAWERQHGHLPDGAIVALNSGWQQWARTPRFRGADVAGVLHFPGINQEAADFLLRERSVKGLVVDTLSLDHGPSREFPTHTRWLGAGRWGLECAANLDDVPPRGATLVVGPLKLTGASGGPSRVYAFV